MAPVTVDHTSHLPKEELSFYTLCSEEPGTATAGVEGEGGIDAKRDTGGRS